MNRNDLIIKAHYSKMGVTSAEKHPELHTPEYMKSLSAKGIETRRINRMKRALVINSIKPELNCKICGADHQFIDDWNRATYGKVHQKYLEKMS